MSAQDQSIGQELVRIIRAEIRAYDRRKDEAVRLRKVADQAVAEADRAATNARDSKPGSIGDVISAAFSGDLNAQAIDALFRRQQRSHVDFAMGGNLLDPVATDRAQRQQAETAAATASAVNAELAKKTTAWKPRGTGENLPRRRWWQRNKG